MNGTTAICCIICFKLGCNEIAAASAVSSGKLLHTGRADLEEKNAAYIAVFVSLVK